MGSSDSDEHPPTRKRARTDGAPADNAAGNGKKQRGRPRVDTQDETAADRRRTQIRLAQRAYRQRKETTITALKSRVTELESVIDDMNQAFLQFNDSAMASGVMNVKPDLAREMKKTTETFVRLAKEAAKRAGYEGEEQDGDIEEVVSETTLAKKDHPLRPSDPSESPPNMAQERLDIGLGYQQIFEAHNNHQPRTTQEMQMASYLSGLTTNSAPSPGQPEPLPFGLIADPMSISPPDSPLHQFHVRVPSPPLGIDLYSQNVLKTTTIRSPYTYSFQEPTFSRRLQRAAIERGFHLLSSSIQRPNVYKHVFKLSLLSFSREQLIERFRNLLTKSNLESLDYWRSPYIHLGGAGTHYPQRDMNGLAIPKPNSWTVQGMGPFSPLVRLFSNTGQVKEVAIDLRGFEGEWFDPHDVEGYLEEAKNCVIDPLSSFAEAWVDVAPTPEIENLGSPLAIDVGMSLSNADAAFFPPLSSTRGATPVNGSLTSSRSSSSSDTVFTATSTPQTPIINDLKINPSTSETELFSHLGMSTDGTADLLTTDPELLMLSSAPPAKQSNDLFPNLTFSDNFRFDTGGMFDGSGPELESMFDILNARTAAPAAPPQRKKKLVTVDVNKFIEELTNRGVCLGRSPGFRRLDVDRAFTKSLIHTF